MADNTERINGPGVIHKAAALGAQEVTEAELAEINKHTLEPLEAADVFTFRAILCDNEIDRDFERFSLKALRDLQKLFLGKTIIKDHTWSADNQVARIYSTELVETGKTTKAGEEYTQLVAHCYMVKTAGNADLIAEIKAGIKKEGSVGCAASSCVCSICGVDNSKTFCPHWPGRSYAKASGDKEVCTFLLDGARDAYEFSLVAVPAQRAAGVHKSYTGETVYAPKEGAEPAEEVTTPPDTEKATTLALRARLAANRAKFHTINN